MYSLLLLLISFIAQIAVAEALAHRHYTRLNHAEKPNIRWMMNNVRHTRHGPIYRSIPDPTPNGQGASAFDSGALGDPTFTSKALVSVVLLAYFVIALGYAIRYHRRKSHSSGLDPTRLPTCCDPSCVDCNEA